jgi:hypothetical protein
MDHNHHTGPQAEPDAPPTVGAEWTKPKSRRPRRALYPDVRDHQITMLEAVYQRPFEQAEPEWRRALGEMRLQLWDYIAARLVIDGGAWREKDCPYGYVAMITRRKAKRLMLADSEAKELQLRPVGGRSIEATIDYLGLGLSRAKNGVWRARTPDGDPYDPSPVDSIDDGWLRPDGDPGFDVKWNTVAQTAGLDDIETEILESRSLGLSRSALLEGCQTEAERLELQAGWKRLSRKMPRIREVLRTQKNISRRTSPIS